MYNTIKVEIINDELVTDSKRVAEVFEKQHAQVLRDIDALKDVSNFGEMFSSRNEDYI